MAPTICSGKKRQSHTIATSNVRRHGQGSHQLNQALSNIVNFVDGASVNPRISTSLRIRSHTQTEENITSTFRNFNHEADLNYNNHLTHSSADAPSSYHRSPEFSFMSDNAVTSSTQSDTENSFDLRLANEKVLNDSTVTSGSSATAPSNATSLSSLSDESSLTSHKEKMPTATLQQCQDKIFDRYSTVMQTNNVTANGAVGDGNSEVTEADENDSDNKFNSKKGNKSEIKHSDNLLNTQNISCIDFDEEKDVDEGEDEDEDLENTNRQCSSSSSMSAASSDAVMDTDESDSMTSLDTEKSAKLKCGNHHLLRDKLLAAQLTKHNSNCSSTKSLRNIRNTRKTEGLLSIAIKTIKLVKRNQLLQQRLTQLQLETSEFIQSVLANPENRHFHDNTKQKVQELDNV